MRLLKGEGRAAHGSIYNVLTGRQSPVTSMTMDNLAAVMLIKIKMVPTAVEDSCAEQTMGQ